MSAPIHELETLRDWLRWSVTRFGESRLAFGHGTTNAWDEAAYLLLHALSLPLDRLEVFLDARLTQHERAKLGELLAQRADAARQVEEILDAHPLSELLMSMPGGRHQDCRPHLDRHR
mgnify:CR=1 FL=1